MEWIVLLVIGVVALGFLLLTRASFVSAAKARQLLREGALVVDVRNPGEFDSGHLSGAINIPLGRLGTEISRSVPDRNRVLLLHCLSGTRSAVATRQLKQLGYPNVFNLGSYSRAEGIVGR